MYQTLNVLIAELERMKEAHGGECQVGVEDADTNWSLPIQRVYFDSREQRVLIFADYNPSPDEDFPERPQMGKRADEVKP